MIHGWGPHEASLDPREWRHHDFLFRFKILPEVEHMEFDFGDFSLEYTGCRFVDLAPVTLPFNIAQFNFRDKNGKTQSIEISAGQLPPPAI